jgi:hypothetical protein
MSRDIFGTAGKGVLLAASELDANILYFPRQPYNEGLFGENISLIEVKNPFLSLKLNICH